MTLVQIYAFLNVEMEILPKNIMQMMEKFAIHLVLKYQMENTFMRKIMFAIEMLLMLLPLIIVLIII